jgi:hypothetical protein
MQLSPEQLKKLSAWAAEGQSLSGIQKRLEEEFSLRVTYMELRFLLDDYSISITNAPEAKPVEMPKQQKASVPVNESQPAMDGEANPDAGQPSGGEAQETELAGGVTVNVDRLGRPGAVISGDVTFSDGVKAKWYLDTMGRLGLDGVDKAYRPTPADVQDFQIELQKILQSKGY